MSLSTDEHAGQPAVKDFAQVFMDRLLLSRKEKVDRAVADPKFSFVHYTAAATVKTIIDSQTVWLRNARLMNDFQEIEYGNRIWQQVMAHEPGQRLRQFVLKAFPELPPDVFDWRELVFSLVNDTYIFSLSEHGVLPRLPDGEPDPEDFLGRLAMWRAYGPRHGAALKINKQMFVMEEEFINCYSTPVEYLTPIQLAAYISGIVDFLEAHIQPVQEMGAAQFAANLTYYFALMLISTKHPGFSEEREWRIFFTEQIFNFQDKTEHHDNVTEFRDEVLDGIPQRVFVIKLEALLAAGQTAAEPANLIERVIIGPTAAGSVIFPQLGAAMRRRSIPGDRLWPSDIPLRT